MQLGVGMITELLDYLKDFNVQTIIGMIVISWYFSRDLKASIDALDKDVRAMNTRIGRMEGTVYGKDIYKHIDKENG